MNDFDAILELHRSETYVSPEEKRYESFLRELETELGLKDLDGDQDHDGYSLDFAYDMFADGLTVKEAAEEFRVSIRDLEGQEHDGQPTMYEEYQDLHGGDDWDHGQYDDYGDF